MRDKINFHNIFLSIKIGLYYQKYPRNDKEIVIRHLVPRTEGDVTAGDWGLAMGALPVADEAT